MPAIRISDNSGSVGRRKEFTERILAPFRDGTLARIARVLSVGEDRTAFIRDAVERELRRREREKASSKK